MITDSHAWAEETFRRCRLGDKRRTERLVQTAAFMARYPGSSLYRACKEEPAAAEGGYRFVRNPSVEPVAILEGGFEGIREKVSRSADVILAIEDTTGMTYQHAAASELEGINSDADTSRGWLIHSVLAVAADSGEPIGLLHQKWWQRDPNRLSENARRKQAYEDRESYKWEEASRAVLAALDEATCRRLVWVCDREAGIKQFLSFLTENGQRFVIRAAWNRRTSDGYLWEQMASLPVAYERTIQIEQRAGRPARSALLSVRYSRLRLQPKDRAPIDIGVVWATEKSSATKEGLEWMLLTSELLDSDAAAERVLDWYEKRWIIEEFHKAWKSGCKARAVRLGTPENLQRVVAILAFLAVRLLQLKHAHKVTPNAPCSTLLAEREWKLLWAAAHRKRPQKPTSVPTIEWAIHAIARLGGWGDTKRTGRPGWDVLTDGLCRLRDFEEGLSLYHTVM